MDQLAENTIVTVALHPGLEQFFKQQKPHNYKKNERTNRIPDQETGRDHCYGELASGA